MKAVKISLVAAIYCLIALASLNLSLPGAQAVPIWAPSAIALSAVLIIGVRASAGIAIGAAIANAVFLAKKIQLSQAILFGSFGAIGNAIEPIIGLLIIKALSDSEDLTLIRSPRNVMAFFVACAIMPIGPAILGPIMHSYAGLSSDNIQLAMITWLVGDFSGALLFAPAILSMRTNSWSIKSTKRSIEFALMVAIASALFISISAFKLSEHYLLLAPVLWSAIRFGHRETKLIIMLSSIMVAIGSVIGFGNNVQAIRAIMSLQLFLTFAYLSGLLIVSVVHQKTVAEVDLEHTSQLLTKRNQRLEGLLSEAAQRQRGYADQINASKTALTR